MTTRQALAAIAHWIATAWLGTAAVTALMIGA